MRQERVLSEVSGLGLVTTPVGPAECVAAEDTEASTASVFSWPACAIPAAVVSLGPSTVPAACPSLLASAFPSCACPVLDGEEGGLGRGAALVSCMGAPACSELPLGSLIRSAKALSSAWPSDSPAPRD